jgi:hypothetical protein
VRGSVRSGNVLQRAAACGSAGKCAAVRQCAAVRGGSCLEPILQNLIFGRTPPARGPLVSLVL